MKIVLAGALACAALLSGCSNPIKFIEREHRVHPLTMRNADLTRADAAKPERPKYARSTDEYLAVNLDEAAIPVSGRTEKPINVAQVSDRESRDAWIFFLKERSDKMCEQHENAIVAGVGTTRFFTGLGTSVFGGIGALVRGSASQIWSGLAGASGAIGSHYMEAFMQNQLATAIVRAMRRNRELIANRVMKSMGEYPGYTMAHALNDLGEYHRSCSFYDGLIALTDDKQKIAPVALALEAQQESLTAELTRFDAEIDKAQQALDKAKAQTDRDRWARRLDALEAQRGAVSRQRAIVVAQQSMLAPGALTQNGLGKDKSKKPDEPKKADEPPAAPDSERSKAGTAEPAKKN